MRRVAARLHDEFRVDAGLDDAISRHGAATIAGLSAAQAAIGTRIRALQLASGELRQLLSTLADLARLARFTPEGWPERRDELAAAFGADPAGGAGEWVEECCLAAAELRTEALERLTAESFGFPPGLLPMRQRFQTAQRALAKRNWRLAQPVLRAAAGGLRIAGSDVPSPEVRAALFVMLARIAVHLGEDPSADLEAAEALAAPAADTALVRAWSARVAKRPGDAASCLADARAAGSSIAVIAEFVRQARGTSAEAMLSAARDRLGGVASIADITSQLDRLIEPVPPELWLAAAERALAENDHSLVMTALDRAEGGVGDQYALGAVICERRAELLPAAGGDEAAVVQAWLNAGDYRWSAGEPDVARRDYRAALDLRPDSVQAALGEVSAEAAEWSAKPGGESTPHLTELLGKLESLQAEHGIELATSWSLLNVAAICTQLANAGENPDAGYMWRAMLAIGRALIFDPRAAGIWVQLADVFGTFSLLQSAAYAARHAFSLDPARQQREELIRATINVGDLATGRDLLSEDADYGKAWTKAVDGFIRWRIDGNKEAIELLRDATNQDPGLTWARDLLMRAYLLSGEPELARREARQLSAYVGGRRDQQSLGTLANCALMSGDLAEAERLGIRLAEWESRNIDEAQARSTLGSAKLLTRRAEGVDDLVQAVMLARAPRDLDDWERIDLPVLRAQARELGVGLPDLTPVTEAIGRRRGELEARTDPLVELTEAPVGTPVPAAADQARAVLRVLLSEAHDDPAGALAALEAGAPAAAGVPEWPRLADRVRRAFVADCLRRDDLGQALAAEQARLAHQADGDRGGRLMEIAELLSAAGRHDDASRALAAARERAGYVPELTRTEGDLLWRRGLRAGAVKAWSSACAGGAPRMEVRLGVSRAATDTPAAARLLHDAIASSYIDTATDLHSLLAEPEDIAAVLAALGEAGSDADTEPGSMIAARVLRALPGKLELPEHPLAVHLPPSWFAGAKDPVNDVPLLARYIPEARLRLPWTLPGVQAYDDESLEPDGYRIFVLGELAEQGHVPPRCDYVHPAAVPLLSAAAQARATEERVMELVAVRCPGGPDLSGLDVLLLMPAAEVIARRIEVVATIFSASLQQYWAWQPKT
ncbi:MAG: hypothetical protein JOY82_28305 [Streptosporangiaceae bacterium]|nr:hypothetical protein [Streptosporangiaceae bacterium]MBV9858388.1 hypothetical protein [Streptosporangiaceae bacterium]